jgi:hypothetical protein
MTLTFTDFAFDRALCAPACNPSVVARWERCARTGQLLCRWQPAPRVRTLTGADGLPARALPQARAASARTDAQLAALLRRHRELRAA